MFIHGTSYRDYKLAVNFEGLSTEVQSALGSTKRAHVSLCCFGCRVKDGSANAAGAGGGAMKVVKKKKKKKK